MPDDLAMLTAEDFRPHVGTRFAVPAGLFQAELIEVDELDAAAAGGLRAPFSLIFRGPSSRCSLSVAVLWPSRIAPR